MCYSLSASKKIAHPDAASRPRLFPFQSAVSEPDNSRERHRKSLWMKVRSTTCVVIDVSAPDSVRAYDTDLKAARLTSLAAAADSDEQSAAASRARARCRSARLLHYGGLLNRGLWGLFANNDRPTHRQILSFVKQREQIFTQFWIWRRRHYLSF